MMYKRPLRLTTLHFEQRFLIDDETFILFLLLATTKCFYVAKGLIILAYTPAVQYQSGQG